jgi:hypothetical protein
MCSACSLRTDSLILMAIGKFIVSRSPPSGRFETGSYLRSLEESAGACSACGGALQLVNDYTPMICLQLPSFNVRNGSQQPSIEVSVSLASLSYRLTGIVYFGAWDKHFASRVVDRIGRVYRYDSMLHGGKLAFERTLNEADGDVSWLSTLNKRCASLVVYTLQD